MDVFYLAGIVGFCTICLMLVRGCERLHRTPGRSVK